MAWNDHSVNATDEWLILDLYGDRWTIFAGTRRH